jgi:hypothetical protein
MYATAIIHKPFTGCILSRADAECKYRVHMLLIVLLHVTVVKFASTLCWSTYKCLSIEHVPHIN